MSSSCAAGSTSDAFRWKRSGALLLRPPSGPEWDLLTARPSSKAPLAEARLASGTHYRIATTDSRIAAGFAVTRGRWKPDRLPEPWSARPAAILRAVEPASDGPWAIRCGLWLHRRRRYHDGLDCRLFRLAGPAGIALFALRHGLAGYITGIILHRYSEFAPSLCPRAYLQQIGAGSIDAPLLAAHLRFGARPVALVDAIDPPICILRWRRH